MNDATPVAKALEEAGIEADMDNESNTDGELEDDEESSEEIETNPNRKVKFADTYTQRVGAQEGI